MLLLSVVLSGCPEEPGVPAPGTPKAKETPPPQEKLTAEMLSPTFRLLGAEGSIPAGVEIQLKPAQVFRTLDGGRSLVHLAPDVPGTLSVVAPNRLEFKPSKSFDLSTDFEISLDRVDSKDGVLTPPSGQWTWKFSTPAFKLARLFSYPVKQGEHEVSADLVFTGAVDPGTAKKFVSATIDGKSATVVLEPGANVETLRANISSPKLEQGSKVEVAVRKGLPHQGSGKTAQAASETFTIVSAGEVTIHAANLKQGSAGPYIELICNDTGAGGSRFQYDRETGQEWNVSARCQPGLVQAKEKIRFEPEIEFTVAPGRLGFDLFGNLKRGEIKLIIDEGLVTLDGSMLHKRFEQTFTVPARKPEVSLSAGGRYLPRSAWRNLAVKHVNVEQAELTVRQVPPANLVYWMSDDATEQADDRNSTQLLLTPIALRAAPDEEKTTWVDVGSLLPATTRGVLQLTLVAPGVAKTSSSRILLTDMAVVAKRSVTDPQKPWAEEIWAWVVGIDDTAPVRGAEVSLVRRNGQALARCNTDAEGACRLSVNKGDNDPSQPFALIARNGEDVTYVKFADLKIESSGEDIAGEPFLSGRPYRATFYTDRGVYRPGDVAHVVALLRGRDGNAPSGGVPVTVKITDPRARLAKALSLKANEAGLASFDLPFEAFADTGKWTFDLEIAEAPIATGGVQVEEFVPERMRVEAAISKASLGFDDEAPVAVSARYLFGGSADGSEVQMTCEILPASFRPKANAGFTYGVFREEGSAAPKAVSLGQQTGTLDEEGKGTLTCPAPSSSEASFEGPGTLVAKASVFEAGSGRSTIGIASVPVHPEAFYVGLDSKTRRAQAGTPLAVEGVVVDWEGNPLSDGKVSEVEIDLVRMEPQLNDYYYEGDGEEGESIQRTLHPVAEWSGAVRVERGSKFRVELTPREKASLYLVRARAGNARADLQIPGAYDGYNTNLTAQKVDLTPRPGRPAGLLIDGPAKAKVGEVVTVKLKAPWAGRALFTAETSQVLASEWRNVGPGEVTWSFTLKEFAPNVYASALLVKDPHLESKQSYMPDRAFGVTSITVEPTAWKQEVTLTAPKEVRSNSDFEVAVDVGQPEGPTYATVAVVDEGILQLTSFKSPDPLAVLFAQRALGVETYETVGWTLLVPPAGTTKSHGGDDEGGEGPSARVQPVKPVALWSGVVKVPDSGRVSIPFHVPLYRGKLRVMAVTSGPKRIGAASASIAVVDPIVVQTTIPRFLTYGDTFQVPVFLTNMSGKPLDISIAMAAENLPVPGLDAIDAEPEAIKFVGKPQGKLKLEPAKSGTVVFQARANRMLGAAKIRVTAKGGGFESKDELDVPFLPPGPRDRETQKLQISGKTVDLKGKVKGWLPTSESTTFWVTSNPYGEAFTNLRSLIHYPYG
ncbi:MAG TPA: MG2 domain-containing protein [Myxococcaceae bacterium]